MMKTMIPPCVVMTHTNKTPQRPMDTVALGEPSGDDGNGQGGNRKTLPLTTLTTTTFKNDDAPIVCPVFARMRSKTCLTRELSSTRARDVRHKQCRTLPKHSGKPCTRSKTCGASTSSNSAATVLKHLSAFADWFVGKHVMVVWRNSKMGNDYSDQSTTTVRNCKSSETLCA